MQPTLAPTVLRGNFVLLQADGLRLLLPQHDVGSAEYLDQTPRASALPGLFELEPDAESQTRSIAALSPQMDLLPEFPVKRFLMTSLCGQDDIALCWNEVRVMIDAEVHPQPLPPVMLPPEAPLREFVELADGIAFCCTGERLLAHVFSLRT
jgi:hypothetical protein